MSNTNEFLEACYECHNSWGKCICNTRSRTELGHEALARDGFEWGGVWITDPTLSCCSRFFVDPVITYGVQYAEWIAKSFGYPVTDLPQDGKVVS